MIESALMGSTSPEFMIDIAARPELMIVIRDSVRTWAQRCGASSHRADRIGLAVDEAVANIIRHAYENDPEGRIRLQCSVTESVRRTQLHITIEDDGKQVPLNEIASRALDDIRPGGLGVHLIHQIMDEVRFMHRPGGGTSLLMRVSLTGMDHQTSSNTAEETVHHGQ